MGWHRTIRLMSACRNGGSEAQHMGRRRIMSVITGSVMAASVVLTLGLLARPSTAHAAGEVYCGGKIVADRWRIGPANRWHPELMKAVHGVDLRNTTYGPVTVQVQLITDRFPTTLQTVSIPTRATVNIGLGLEQYTAQRPPLSSGTVAAQTRVTCI
jgi:hypothetical protein